MDKSAWPGTLASFNLDDALEPARTAPHMRKALRKATPLVEAKPMDIAAVDSFVIPGPAGDLPVRLYVPPAAPERGPCVLYLHGGGYVIGDLDTHDPLCRRLSANGHVRVLAADYRLAPEHRFPAAVDDSLAAFDWLAGEGAQRVGADTDRLAVAGDSAGGGLAAVVALSRRERIRFQLLIYPLLQLVERRKPKLKALEGHILSAFTLEQIARAYLTDIETEAGDPRVSPFFAEDLSRLPPAHIFAAELDPLLDEGRAWRDRLLAHGIPCGYTLGKALPHGYFNLTGLLPGARTLVNRAAGVLGERLNA